MRTLQSDLPKIPNVAHVPLYRAEAHGLETSYDWLQAMDYLRWVFGQNYPYIVSANH